MFASPSSCKKMFFSKLVFLSIGVWNLCGENRCLCGVFLIAKFNFIIFFSLFRFQRCIILVPTVISFRFFLHQSNIFAIFPYQFFENFSHSDFPRKLLVHYFLLLTFFLQTLEYFFRI